MGIFDSIRNALGKGESEPQVTVAPSQLLREAGVDPSGLKFGFGDRSITVSGTVASDADRQKVNDLLSGMDGIDTVQNNLKVAAPPVAEPTTTMPLASPSCMIRARGSSQIEGNNSTSKRPRNSGNSERGIGE